MTAADELEHTLARLADAERACLALRDALVPLIREIEQRHTVIEMGGRRWRHPAFRELVAAAESAIDGTCGFSSTAEAICQ